MRQHLEFPVSFFQILLMVVSPAASALDISIQPKLETGFAHYELTQERLQSPTTIGGRSAISINSVTTSDVMPFVGGGFAVFSGPLFFDFSAQHYFNGTDRSPVQSENVNPAGTVAPLIQADSLTLNQGFQDDRIQRTEWAFSVGYNVNDFWSVYTGYKQAYTNIDSVLQGQVQTAPLSSISQPNPVVSGNYRSDALRAFDYDGPFVGSSVTLDVRHGWLDGSLTGNIAVAFMDGQERLTVSNFILTNQFGARIPIDTSRPASPTIGTPFNGDSVGVTLGLTWKGYTPVDNLNYSIGVFGYRYAFDSDSPQTQDLEETMIRSNFSVSYNFDM